MPGERTLRCAAHRSVRSTGGLAPPARACSGIAQRPLINPTDWPGCSQGICRYASRACSGSASPDEVSSREKLTARSGHLAGRALATGERWQGCCRASRQGAATQQAASAENGLLGSPRSPGTPAGLFTERGEEAARVFQQSQWALAGRALRNPSAACPCGSH